MWMQPPPPVDNHWVLHIAASPHQVDDALQESCVHKHARPAGDPDFPAYLAGTSDPRQPPAWLIFADAELTRRGHRTRWCTPECELHRWPPHAFPKHRQGAVEAGPQAGPIDTPSEGKRHGTQRQRLVRDRHAGPRDE